MAKAGPSKRAATPISIEETDEEDPVEKTPMQGKGKGKERARERAEPMKTARPREPRTVEEVQRRFNALQARVFKIHVATKALECEQDEVLAEMNVLSKELAKLSDGAGSA